MSKKLSLLFLVAISVLPVPVASQALKTGERIPPFMVYAGQQDEPLQSSELSGKVIILTYESRDTVDINKVFKDLVFKTFPDHLKPQSPVAILAIISCFEYVWPIKRICTSAVQKSARRMNMRLYDDRTGDMLKRFGFKKNKSNIWIIDMQGIIRYKHAGKIPDAEVTQVISLIQSLSQQQLSPSEQNPLLPQ